MITIEFEDGTTVKATPEHPFYVKGKGFIEARFLTEDMDIKTFCWNWCVKINIWKQLKSVEIVIPSF